MTTDPLDTEALRRLADAATPGPWAVDGPAQPGPDDSLVVYPAEDGGAVAYVQPAWDDAEFIAAARTAVPALLDALAAAEHRATRAEAQSATRKRQVAYWRAETQRVRDRLRALDGDA